MSDLKFTKTYEWVKVEGEVATVGITDFAQLELGDIVFVELPTVGEKVNQFARLGTIESTKTASEFFSPLTGEVIEVNNGVVKNPQWINEDPYGKGWLVKLKVDNQAEIDNLLDEQSYKSLVEEK
ncbi:MAG: glycine cleavage system protein H [Candidatus Omnitrophica bacterium 4484_70.1]|nr:MAG: glycine cleavage system protein H [Candidatus Omnitrophica bacterium 4484_70.1]